VRGTEVILMIQMRAFVLAIVLALIAAPVLAAEMIKPEEAPAHVGQIVTVEGTISDVHHAKSGRATFLNMGGRYPNNVFPAVIFADDASKFPDVDQAMSLTYCCKCFDEGWVPTICRFKSDRFDLFV